MKLLNAFSLNMLGLLAEHDARSVGVQRVPVEKARRMLAEGGLESAVGHADTAALLSGLLGMTVPVNRATVVLAPGEVALVAQYVGPRLPEGATTLPEGAEVRFFRVVADGARIPAA